MPLTRQRVAAPPVELTLEDRLALTQLAMDARLAEAHAAMNVRTAHLPSVDPIDITHPVAAPAAPCPYSTPVAQALHRARARVEAGWCRGRMRDEQGAVCLLGAVEAEGGGQAAVDVLWEVIRRAFPGAASVNGWNDQQRDSGLPLLILDRAASLAHARGM